MGSIVPTLVVVAAVAVIVWRGIALYNYGFHKKDL
jgi:hypothetical protein